MSKIENYLGIANHDIQMANNSQELKSYVASILCENDELQQENQELKKIVELYSKSLYNAKLTKYKEVIEKIKTRYCDYYGTTKEINDDYYLGKLKKILSYKEVE